MASVLEVPVLTVVVIGSECTGKSTLAAKLAERFGAPVSREFAREYAERRAGVLDASDVEPIAKGQIEQEHGAERRAREAGGRLVIRDTDLYSTIVYSRHYYGGCPRWVEEAAARRAGDLYLLLAPDVSWVADGVRDRPDAAVRAEIHAAFRSVLRAAAVRLIEIGGGWQSREAEALDVVSGALDAADRTGTPPSANDGD